MADNNYRFQPPASVRTTNRVNTSGQPPAKDSWLGSLRIANIVPAAVGGIPGTLQIPAFGTQFYFRVLTNPVQVKCGTMAFSEFAQGEGQNFHPDNAFSLLEFRNESALPIVFEVCISFAGFIDNKLILSQATDFRVAYPTYSTASAAALVDIDDLSGSQFDDINGDSWYALWREEIVVYNLDAGVTLLLQEAGSVVANGPAVGVIYPVTAIRFPFSGNYRLHAGGGNINAIVSEVYHAIPATVL